MYYSLELLLTKLENWLVGRYIKLYIVEKNYSLSDVINRFGKDSIPILESVLPEILSDFSSYPKKNFYHVLKISSELDANPMLFNITSSSAEEVISLLKNNDVNFEKLGSLSIKETLKILGKKNIMALEKAIHQLKELGVDFGKMDEWSYKDISALHGKKAVSLLMDAGANFTNINNLDIFYIVRAYGKEMIGVLKKAGADFGKLDSGNIKDIVERCGVESISLLADAGADFGKLASENIKDIVERCGVESISLLADAGADFVNLYGKHIKQITYSYGNDAISLLIEGGADFEQMPCLRETKFIDRKCNLIKDIARDLIKQREKTECVEGSFYKDPSAVKDQDSSVFNSNNALDYEDALDMSGSYSKLDNMAFDQ